VAGPGPPEPLACGRVILHVAEYPGLPARELRNELGAFHPPQGYVRLSQHPRMLAVCEKVATETPIREMPLHHR